MPLHPGFLGVLGTAAAAAAPIIAPNYSDTLKDFMSSGIAHIVHGRESGDNYYGNKSSTLSPDQKVFLVSSVGGSTVTIAAPLPQNFALSVDSTWAPQNGIGALAKKTADYFFPSSSGIAGATPTARDRIESGVSALAGFGGQLTNLAGTTLKETTGHYWQSGAPINGSLSFEFIAESDPDSEVIEPVKQLYKLATPIEQGHILIPPGPSIAGSVSGTGLEITIYVGSILIFRNVIIESVSGEIDTRLSQSQNSSANHKILHAKIDVTFKTMYTVSDQDIDSIFKGETYSTTR